MTFRKQAYILYSRPHGVINNIRIAVPRKYKKQHMAKNIRAKKGHCGWSLAIFSDIM